MGNQPSHHGNSSAVATAAGGDGGGVGVRSVTTNRRSSNTGAITTSSSTSLSPVAVITTTSTSTSSSSPSVSQHSNNLNTRNPQASTPTSSSSSGNMNSSGGSVGINIRNMFQQLQIKHGQNALGITRMELEERCKPSGLYSTCHWEDKTIRRMIGDGKLASRQQWDADKYGIELDAEHHECPICFFTYPQMNVTKCCQANICTECYLQLQPYQKPNSQGNQSKPIVMNAKSQQNSCPFCNTAKLIVTVGPMKQIESQQQQPQLPEQPLSPPPKMIADDQPESNPHTYPTTPTPTSGFGSSLEQNSRVAMMRARSCSIASEHSHSSSTTPSVKEQQEMVSQLAMTIQERQQIEEEMRAQHLHPLALKIEQEEMERRLKNQLQYYSQQQQQQQQRNAPPAASSLSSDQLPIPRRNLLYPTPPQQPQQRPPSIVPPTLSNILFLQHPARAAYLQQQSPPTTASSSSSLAVRGLSEEQQIAMAIEASLRDSTTATTTTTTTN